MDTIKIINYVIMVIFFTCYAYQFFYIPLALLKKRKPLPEVAPLVCKRGWKPITHSKSVSVLACGGEERST